MFGKKKDFMNGMGKELIAAYTAATNHAERDSVVKKYEARSGHSTNGIRGYLVKRNIYIMAIYDRLTNWGLFGTWR